MIFKFIYFNYEIKKFSFITLLESILAITTFSIMSILLSYIKEFNTYNFDLIFIIKVGGTRKDKSVFNRILKLKIESFLDK